MDVPPTLVSFAIAPCDAERVISPEFKVGGNGVYLFGRGDWERVTALIAGGTVVSARAVENTGVEGEVFRMAVGNEVGFTAETGVKLAKVQCQAGAIVAECVTAVEGVTLLGHTAEMFNFAPLVETWEKPLSEVFR